MLGFMGCLRIGCGLDIGGQRDVISEFLSGFEICCCVGGGI